jgi:hypothetical protein
MTVPSQNADSRRGAAPDRTALARSAARIAGTAAVAVVLGVLPVAAAQQPAPAAPVAPADSVRRGGAMPEELRRRVDELRRRRLAEYLRLDEELADRIDAELRAFREHQAQLRIERQGMLEELRRAIDALEDEDAFEDELSRHLDALRRNEEARERSLRELRETLSRGLTVEQQARLQLFAERFAREMRDRVEGFRDRRERIKPVPPERRRPGIGPSPRPPARPSPPSRRPAPSQPPERPAP